MKRCIKCGKSGEFRLFCPECYLEEHPLIRKIKTEEVHVCLSCSKLFQNNKWKPVKNVEGAIEEALAPKIELDKDYTLKKLKVEADLSGINPRPGLVKEIEANLKITAESEENRCLVSDEFIVPIKLDLTPCGHCSLSGTKYFEGTLQVRNIKQEMVPKIREIVEREKEAGIHINDTVEVKDGAMDFYITDVHYMKKLGKVLQQKFGGELSMSPRLQTRDGLASKDLYRLSVLLKLPNVRPGDYIEHEGRVLKVKKAEENIIGRDIINNTNVKIDAKKESPMPLEIHKTTVTRVRPSIEAINPYNYQSTRIENARKQKMGQKIRIVVASDKLYIID